MLFKFFRAKGEERGEPLRAVGILRVAMTDVQPRGIRRWCRKNNATVIGWADDDCSPFGSLWDRPELGKWLSSDPPKKWDLLIAHTMDRVTAIQKDAIDLIEWCREHDKRFVLADEPVDSAAHIPPSTLTALFPEDPDARTARTGDRDM